MSQFKLSLATKANQASLLPVLLVATSINEARPTPVIAINFEDAAVLPEGEKAIVQFTGASGAPVYGTDNAIKELRASFPFLNGKDEKSVSDPASPSLQLYADGSFSRRTNGFPSLSPSPPLTSRLSTLCFSA